MLSYAEHQQKTPEKNADGKDYSDKKPAANITGIPDATKAAFESASGFSFDDVRVHYNSDKPTQLQAHAYTQGNQVYIAHGQERHLKHELGHVVQQKSGYVKPTMNVGGVAINDDTSLEREADLIGGGIDTAQFAGKKSDR